MAVFRLLLVILDVLFTILCMIECSGDLEASYSAVPQLFYAAKMLPIVKIPLVVAVTALHLAIVPRRSRRNQNMFDTPFLQQLIHRIFLGFTDEFVSIATSKIAVTLDNCSKK